MLKKIQLYQNNVVVYFRLILYLFTLFNKPSQNILKNDRLLDSTGMNYIDLLILNCLLSGSRIFPSHRHVIRPIYPLKDCKNQAYAWRVWPFTCSRERSAITQDLGLQGLVRRTIPVSRLLRQAIRVLKIHSSTISLGTQE